MNLRNKLTTLIQLRHQQTLARLSRNVLLILTLLALSISVAAQEGESCKLTGVDVGFTASICSHHDYTVTFAGTQVAGTGDCTAEQWVTSDLTYAKLKVDETYTLTVGADSCSTHVNFVVPEGYYLEIDGVVARSIDKVGGTTKGSGDGSWQVVLRQKCPCVKGGPGESGGAKRGSVLWQVGMGSLSNGMPAYNINLREAALSTFVYTPAALIYSPPGRTSEVDVVRNVDQSLRQVKAPQALANVVVISPTEYEIRFYRPADVGTKVGGVYPVSGQPFVTWKIKNPDPSSNSKLQISKTQGATTDTSEYTWDAISESWALSTGNGARLETSSITYPTSTSRVETVVVKDNNNVISSKTSRTFHTFPWGERLIQEVLDPDGAALKTVYSYYENGAETGRYSQLKSVVNPDGSWEQYDYDSAGNKVLILRPWKDQSITSATEDNSHATRYTFSNSDGIITSLYTNLVSSVTEKIGGVTVGKTTYSRTATTANGQPAVVVRQTIYSSLTESLVTTSTHYHETAAATLANRMISTEYPDGRKDSISYEKGNYVPNADPALSTFTADINGLAERETVVHGTVTSPLGIQFKTTKETSVRDQFGHEVLQETYVYNGVDYERIGWTSSQYDDRGHVIASRNHKGEVTTTVWNGDLKTSEIDATGIETVYTYDSVNRVKTQTKKGIAAAGGFPAQQDILTTFTYDADGHVTIETVSSSGLSLTTSRGYDKAGRMVRETDRAGFSTDEEGLTTTYTYANGGRTQTITRPGGSTEIIDKYIDSRSKSTTGSAIVAHYFDYGVNADGTQYTQEFTGSAGLSSPRWTRSTADWAGRTVTTERPTFTADNLVQTSSYNALGQLDKQTTTAAGVKLIADKLFTYDELGNQLRAGSDMDASGTLVLNSTDRINETESSYEKVGSDWFQVSSNKIYLVDNNATPVIQIERNRLNNFPLNGTDQTVAEVSVTDVAGNITKTTTSVDRAAKKETTTTDTPDSNINGISITVNGLLQSSTPTTLQTTTTYGYDSLGRQISVTDPRTGITTQAYSSSSGQLASSTDGAGTTTYEYFDSKHVNAGRLKSQTNASSKKIYFNYNSRGEVLQTWGDATYPLEYVYDTFGQRTELHTFRAGQNWTTAVWPAATGLADVTKWIYHPATGLMIQKQDATLKGLTYTYNELGQPRTRTWARGTSSTYGYDSNTGELLTITYSDSTTPVTLTYDRGGRQVTATDAAGTSTRSFNVGGELQTEQVSGSGVLNGAGISVGYDGFLRRNSLQTSHSTNTLSSQTYGYDATSRLETVTSGGQTVTYAYYPNNGFLNTTTFTGGTTIARGYDSFGRLQNITTTPAADVAQSYNYTYNNLNQRTRVTREDNSYWSYLYNDRGELVSGKRYWPDNSIVWGAQTEYSFDNIGNRNYSRNGGNQFGNLRQSNYTINSLNQYSQRSVPGMIDVAGTANPAAAVTVNNLGTVTKGEYFYKELTVDNSAAPASSQIHVVGARNNFGPGGEDAVTQKDGRVFLPKASETFTYDDDGNLTSDSRWNYSWDGENRLISIEAAATAPVEAKRKLEFIYDYRGRRIQKKTYRWNILNSTYELELTRKFIYDDWHLIAELDGANLPVRTYVRGSRELLLINGNGNTYQVGHDGNKNVGVLVNAASGKLSASYDYDPFGQTLKTVGDFADANPFRFSSQYTDDETGLIYYGYRYYNPQLGRWISRDPIEERGGASLYGFVNNDGINNNDVLGLRMSNDFSEDGSDNFGRMRRTCVYTWFPTPPEKKISISIDDGPRESTQEMLKFLRQVNILTTFFVIGQNAKLKPGDLKDMLRDGHLIANHTWDHPVLTSKTDAEIRDELQKTDDLVTEKAGLLMKPNWRPPYGAINARVRRVTESMGYSSAWLWDVDSLDWKYRGNTQAIINQVTNDLRRCQKSTCHVLFHDFSTSVKALRILVPKWKEEGYRIVNFRP
jgi:RHS repeat-associated protein